MGAWLIWRGFIFARTMSRETEYLLTSRRVLIRRGRTELSLDRQAIVDVAVVPVGRLSDAVSDSRCARVACSVGLRGFAAARTCSRSGASGVVRAARCRACLRASVDSLSASLRGRLTRHRGALDEVDSRAVSDRLLRHAVVPFTARRASAAALGVARWARSTRSVRVSSESTEGATAIAARRAAQQLALCSAPRSPRRRRTSIARSALTEHQARGARARLAEIPPS